MQPKTHANREGQLDLSRLDDLERVSLCEALDRVLNKGAVVTGQVTISVAGIELVYLGLQLALMSVETARSSAGSASLLIKETKLCN